MMRNPLSVFLLLGVVALSGCTASAEQHTAETLPVAQNEGRRVEVAVINTSDAGLDLVLTGEVEGWRDANLASALGGYVEDVRVSGGDRVRKGELLVAVDRALYGAAYSQAEAQHDQAVADHDRLVKMGDGVSASQLQQAGTQVKVAKANLQQASLRLSRASVVAPFDGVVSAVAVEQGEVTGPATPVARLVQLDPAKVVVSVSDRDVSSLEPGMAVQVTAAAIGRQLAGTIHHVSPVGDGKTRSFTVEVEVANPDHILMPGMVARVMTSRDLGQALVVPQDWVISTRDGHGVYVVEEGAARWRPIELGQVLRNQVLVTGGLNVGDRVVMVGHRELLDGDPVLVAREGQCCSAGRVDFGGVR